MKLIAPLALALAGLGAGVAAGVALKPAPPEAPAACGPGAPTPAAQELAAHEPGAPEPGDHESAAAAPCEAPAGDAAEGHGAKAEADGHAKTAVAPLDKPLVAPVFAGDRVKAMVVASLAVALPEAEAAEVEAAAPRLRDAFLKVMFAHANSGGFDGAFTEGRKMEDLRAALLKAGRGVLGDQVSDVLITEIARQDM